jgi:TonB family protein
MERDTGIGEYPGSSLGGVALLEKPRVRWRDFQRGKTVRAASAAVHPSERPSTWRWLKAAGFGLFFTFLLFAILGWIQPVFSKSERIEIPLAVRLAIESGTQAKKGGQASQKVKPQPRTEARAEEKARAKSSNLKRTTAPSTVASQAPRARSEAKMLQNLNLFGAVGSAAGTGGGIKIGFSSEEEETLEQGRQHREYMERRRQIRDDPGASRGRSDFGGAGRSAAGDMDLKLGGAEPAYLPEPDYPKLAEKEQVEGFVKVRLLISVTGAVERFEIVAASPPGYFEESIKKVLPRWRFNPALDEQGRPVEFWEEYTYQFKLEAVGI